MRRRTFAACALFAAVFLAAPPFHEVPAVSWPDRRSGSAATAAEAVRWTEDAADHIAIGAAARVTAEPHIIARRGGPIQRRWETGLWDDSGCCLAEFVWDADNGDLLSYQRGVDPAPPPTDPGIDSRRDAVEASRQWMSTLRVRGPSPRWTVRGVWGSTGRPWRTSWTCAGQTVGIGVDQGGGLRTFTHSRLFGPPT